MERKPFALLELGSNSLKFYLVNLGADEKHTVETHKMRWRISHQFFNRGFLDKETIAEVVKEIEEVRLHAKGLDLGGTIAVATGVFREIDNVNELVDAVKDRTGVRIRVISGEDEAMLMARGFALQGFHEPVILCDLGGATTEWVWLKDGKRGQWGSMPLGAIRNEYKFGAYKDAPTDYLQRSSAYCDSVLKFLPFNTPVKVLVTGGSAKALACHYKRDVVGLDDLRRFTVEVLEGGAPSDVKPSRAPILLPGLVILWRVLVRCQAKEIQYVNNAVRHGMAVRLIRLLNEYPQEDIHATLLLKANAPIAKPDPEN